MALPPEFLTELRSRLPMAALIGRNVKLLRSGNEHKGCCPFHAERTASFYVYEDHFHCFGCGAHGDAISFVMQSERIEFKDAVDRLAAEVGLEVPKGKDAAAFDQRRRSLRSILDAAATHFEAMLWSKPGAAALAVLTKRGLTPETIKAFRLGWAPRDALQALGLTDEQAIDAGLAIQRDNGTAQPLFFARIMFPILDAQRRVCGFSGRVLGEGKPKYVNGTDTALWTKSTSLYGLERARAAVDGGKALLVVEGQMDVLAAHQAGQTGAVAPLGTALTAAHLATLWKLSLSPIVCFDGDEAGRRAAAKTIDLALPLISPERTLRFARMPQDEDPDSLIRKAGAEAFGRVIEGAQSFVLALHDAQQADDQTPEGRAGFRDRLDAAVNRITSWHLAREYRQALRDHFFQQQRASRSARIRMPPPPPPQPTRGAYAEVVEAVTRQIEEATAAFAADPSQATETRLVKLCLAKEEILRGDFALEMAEEEDA